MDPYTIGSLVIEYQLPGTDSWRTWDFISHPRNWKTMLPGDRQRADLSFRLTERTAIITDVVLDYDHAPGIPGAADLTLP